MDYPLWKKSKICPCFRPRKNDFLAILEEDFSENTLSRVVDLEVSFPTGAQMARSDQRSSRFSKNTEHVSLSHVVRHINAISGLFGHPGWAFGGRIS